MPFVANFLLAAGVVALASFFTLFLWRKSKNGSTPASRRQVAAEDQREAKVRYCAAGRWLASIQMDYLRARQQ